MKINEFTQILQDLKKRKIPEEVKKTVEILLDKKAEKITVLKLKGISQMTDYIVICQVNSNRQNQAVADSIREDLKKKFRRNPFGMEGEQKADWILVDYVDFIVNIFLPEIRERFAIEKLWMDAKRYDFYPS
jgi:ribosome-associated protein